MLKAVSNRWSPEKMAEHLTEYMEEDFSATTVRRRLKGLSGEKKNVPKKHHCQKIYLKKIPHHPDNAINYTLTDSGRAVVREVDVPLNLNMLSDLEELGRGFGKSGSGGGVRPHKCWSRELIRRKDGDARGGLSWGDRRAVLAEKDIHWEEVKKELPHREQSEVGELVHHGRVRLILFENSVLVRYNIPESDDGIFEVLDEWWETRREALDWLESVFPVRVRSAPLDVSMPLSTQEWGDVRNEFAEWIQSNPEFQDDSPNSLFEVKNEEGERVFHVDTSPTDDLGNDVAEGEFPHSQFGAGHITNMKQAIRWLATLGVKPQDFTAAQWTRDNRDSLQKVVELDAEELENRVGDLEDFVDGLQDDVGSLESQITRLEGKLDGVSSGLQQNRKWVSDVEDRVDDTVQRVDAGRREFHEFKESTEEDIKDNRQEIESVENWFSEEVRDTQNLVQDRVGDVELKIEDVQSSVDGLGSQFSQLMEMQKEQNREIIQELRRLRQLQERSIWNKIRDSVKIAVESVRGVAGGLRNYL